MYLENTIGKEKENVFDKQALLVTALLSVVLLTVEIVAVVFVRETKIGT